MRHQIFCDCAGAFQCLKPDVIEAVAGEGKHVEQTHHTAR